MQDQKKHRLDVFISSSAIDLPDYRRAAIDAAWRCGMYPVAMERSAAESSNALEYSLALADEADIYVGIFAGRYGTIQLETGLSITENEYRRAVARGIPILIFIASDDATSHEYDGDEESQDKLARLKAELRQRHIVAVFSSVEEFSLRLFQSLANVKETTFRSEEATGQPSDLIAEVIPQAPIPYIAHPYVPQAEFIGRVRELAIVDEWVKSTGPVLVLESIGGAGKSAIAWHWINHNLKAISPAYEGVVWWSFYEADATVSNLIRHTLAYLMRTELQAVDNMRMRDRLDALCQILTRRRILLVLDGLERILSAYHRLDAARVRDSDVAGDSAISSVRLRSCVIRADRDFLERLVTISPSKALITTRLVPAEFYKLDSDLLVSGVQTCHVGGMSEQDTITLMRNRRIVGRPDRFTSFMGQFGWHPLLMDVVCGRVRNFRQSPGNFDTWYADEGLRLRLSDLDLSQRRTHILQFALQGLSPALRLLLSQIAAFRYPVDYAGVSVLNPHEVGFSQPQHPKSPDPVSFAQYAHASKSPATPNELRPGDEWVSEQVVIRRIDVVWAQLADATQELEAEQRREQGWGGWLGRISPAERAKRLKRSQALERHIDELSAELRAEHEQGPYHRGPRQSERSQSELREQGQSTAEYKAARAAYERDVSAYERELSLYKNAVIESQGRFHQMLSELEDRGLLQWDRDANRYDLHPIIRAQAYEQLEESQKAATFDRIRDHFERLPPERLESVKDVSELYRTIEIYYALTGRGLLEDAAKFYSNRLADVLEHQLAAFETVEQLLSPFFTEGLDALPRVANRWQQSNLLDRMANSFTHRGAIEQALRVRRVELDLDLRQGAKEDLWATLINFAEDLRLAGHLAASERITELATQLGQKMASQYSSAISQLRLLELYTAMGLVRKAESAYARFIASPPTRQREYWLADAYIAYARLRLQQAKDPLPSISAAESSASQGRNALAQLECLNLRAELSLLHRDYETAATLWEQAIVLAEKSRAPNSYFTVKLAEVALRQADEHAARRLIQEALRGAMAPEESCKVLTCAAHILCELSDISRASEIAVQAYRIAWADGPPYCRKPELQSIQSILVKLGINAPVLPTWRPASPEPSVRERDIRLRIEAIRNKKFRR